MFMQLAVRLKIKSLMSPLYCPFSATGRPEFHGSFESYIWKNGVYRNTYFGIVTFFGIVIIDGECICLGRYWELLLNLHFDTRT